MLISWIIPLYNCECYIGRCIESLRRQGLKEDDYEIIIVDDDSTDNSYSVAASYLIRYTNINLIRQDHHGVGYARNHGLRISKGEYVHFVDADDVVNSNTIGALFRQIHTDGFCKYDMIGFTHRNFTDTSEINTFHTNTHIEIKQYTMYDFCCVYGFRANAVDYIFKREFIERYNFHFGPHTLGEDVIFMLDIYAKTDALILYTPLPVYYYFQRFGSISNQSDIQHTLKIMEAFCNIHKKLTDSASLNVYPKDVLSVCSLSFAKYQGIKSLLAAGFPMPLLLECYKRANDSGLFPISEASGYTQCILAYLSRHPMATFIMSYVYRWVYVPFIRNRRFKR